MGADLLDAVAFLGVHLKHVLEQVNDRRAYLLPQRAIKRDLHLHGLFELFFFVAVSFKRKACIKQDVEDNSEAVDIRL